MWIWRASTVFPLCAALGAGCSMPADRQLPDSTQDVYLLRGLWDFFSLGLDDLSVELQDQGVDAAPMSGPDWERLGNRLVKERGAQADTSNLILVGHSFGADEAVLLARFLDKRGIGVRLLVLIDATNPPRIPANVDRCVHLYIPTALSALAPGTFAGNPVVAERGNTHTEIVNTVISEETFGAAARSVDHFNIESSTLVHEITIDEVLHSIAKTEAGVP